MPDPRTVAGGTIRHGFRDPAYKAAVGEEHQGIDIETPPGSPVTAPVGGVVVYAGQDDGPGQPGGVGVKVRTAGGLDYSVWHLNGASVKVGERVAPGQVLGSSGQTGNAAYPHVHFQAQVSRTGAYVDPDSILAPAARMASQEMTAMDDPTQNTPMAPGAARDAATMTRRNDAAIKQLESEYARVQSLLRPAQQRLELLQGRAAEADSQGQPTPAAKKAASEVRTQQSTVNQLNTRLNNVAKSIANLSRDPTGTRSVQPSPTGALEEVTDPNTGLVVGLRDPATGRTLRIATPRQPAAPRERDPAAVAQDEAAAASSRATTARTTALTPYDVEKARLDVEKAKRALVPDQLRIVQNAKATIDQLQGMLERDEIEPGEASAWMDSIRASADAALQGTTPFELARTEDDARRTRQRMGVDLVTQRVQSGGALASSLMSSAASLASQAMFRPGQTSLHVDPLAAAFAFLEQTNQSAQADPVTAALLQGATTAPTRPAEGRLPRRPPATWVRRRPVHGARGEDGMPTLTPPAPDADELRDDLRRYLGGEFGLRRPMRWRDRTIPHADVANALRHLGYRSRRVLDLRYAEDHLTVWDVCLRLNIGRTALFRYERLGLERVLDVLCLESAPSPS